MTDNELLQALYNDMQAMKADMQTMKADMQTMKADMQTMKAEVQMIKDKVTSIELTLENETNHNIKVIAEGHAILYRRLEDALKGDSEREMLIIQVNHHENELRKINERLEKLEIA